MNYIYHRPICQCLSSEIQAKEEIVLMPRRPTQPPSACERFCSVLAHVCMCACVPCVYVCVCARAQHKSVRSRVCSSVGKASDLHAAHAGSIPRCGKGFSSADSLTRVRTPRVQSHALTSVRTLKIQVHVRVRWIMETLKSIQHAP